MRRTLAVAAMSAVLAVSACASEQPVMSLADLPHAHNVVVVEGQVFVGTHHGLYEFSEDKGFVLVSEDFDVMGLSAYDGVFYASGHPGRGFPFPDPVGLLASIDRGRSWQSVSLTGDVDFHLLDTVGEVMVGAAANYGVMVMSTDRGVTWGSVDWPMLSDFAINPKDANQIVLATGDGLLLSIDGGVTFQAVPGAPAAVKVDWSNAGLTIVANGDVFVSGDPGEPFTTVHTGVFDPIDVARDGDTIAIVDGHTLLVSSDAGVEFRSF